ncbi:O-antigen ligase family protein [Sunxiuqinia sp. sy24]|uniref:O-antigen ligase family protein n=1 Tax=Sunxiuqinia sp. sy24 TaxID=3461495 RepID=UPI00404583EC
MIQLKNINWFYGVLVLLMVALPFSEALISIFGVLLFLISFWYRSRISLANRFKQNKPLLLFSTIYLVYIIGTLFSTDFKWALYDLQKNIPYLIIPLAFIIAGPIKLKQLIKLLKLFVISVSVSALITIIDFYLQDEISVLKAQEFGFIHHIRFSFQVVFSLVISSVLLFQNWLKTKVVLKIATLSLLLFLFLFLIWHQSFTGLLTFIGTATVGLFLLITRIKSKVGRTLAWFTMAFIILAPASYLYYAIDRFYTVDLVVDAELDKQTAQGNPYYHDWNNQQLENGHYVGLYWNETEMQKAWNKRANLKYNEIDKHGYQVKYTLVRYLTSKDLRKDAAGVSQLTKEDIQYIEAGISNHLLAKKGLSLYPRIYTSIWELDTYFKSGYANHQSLSQRIEYTKAALTIIQDHFWFGVGTGNWKSAYDEAYVRNKAQMDPDRFADAHNQYLNYMVKFGLIGLLWILFAICYPVVRTQSYLKPIFFLFLIGMFIANFGDSNFETHVGSSFFVLFYCLFVTSDESVESLPDI